MVYNAIAMYNCADDKHVICSAVVGWHALMCVVLCRAQRPCHRGGLLRRWAVSSLSIWRWLLLRMGLGPGYPEA